MNSATAKAIAALGEQWFQHMEAMLHVIQQVDDAGIQKQMKLALSTMAAELEVEIMGPAYRVCPELRPKDS